VPIVLKCGSLKLLEPSGPVQACNGIALPLAAVSPDCPYSSSYSRPNSNPVCCSPHNAPLQPSQFQLSVLQSTQCTATAAPIPTQCAAVHTIHRYSRPNSNSVCCSPHKAPLQPSQFQLSLLHSTQSTATISHAHLLIIYREGVNKNRILSLISLKVRQTVCMKFHPHRTTNLPILTNQCYRSFKPQIDKTVNTVRRGKGISLLNSTGHVMHHQFNL
jgi:hypothetical protein